jgi:hypothetical protein
MLGENRRFNATRPHHQYSKYVWVRCGSIADLSRNPLMTMSNPFLAKLRSL